MNTLSFRSPINFLGYGIVGFNIFKSFIKDHNIVVSYFPIGNPECVPQYHDIVRSAIENQEQINPFGNTLTIWHEHSIMERLGRGINCGFSFFEIDKFNNRTIRSIQCQDKFLVASQWAKEVVAKEIPNQETHVIKIGVDTDFFKPIKLNADKPYRFLNIGKTEVRKGHDILHELFGKAFTKDDDVELYIAWDNPFMSAVDKEKWKKMYKESPLGDKIVFLERQLDIRTEYAAADCCIFPSRAEAICLPALEAMACNKPVICTNYSGFTEFATKDNSYLVDIDELEPAIDGVWFDGTGNWAKFGPSQEAQFIEYMRYCYNNRITSNDEGLKTAQSLTWKNSTQQILDCLSE